MAPNFKGDKNMIWSATYSNVPVYEFNVDDNHVMRRRLDGWINATQILKVADFDKPARTRILEREVQKGIHEKVQGGYGKYQGTWIPLDLGRQLAEKNGVYEKLKPIFDYVPGNVTPPPAPKHTTAASNKPKAPRAPAVRKPAKLIPVPVQRHFNEENYDNISTQLHDEDSPDNSTVVSESMIDEDDSVQHGHYPGSRKRKREIEQPNEWSKQEEEHRLYADALLDYFMLNDGEAPYSRERPPEPPKAFLVDRPIDTQGHTALHWAAAMGEVEVVKDLMLRGANVRARNVRGETPLIRACLFANCHEKGTFPKIVHLLQNTITIPDNYNGTVFHHVAYTAVSGAKTSRARYYLEVLLNKLVDTASKNEITACLNAPDRQGDTAFHIAARHSRRCTRTFQGAGAESDVPNHNGETVDQYLQKKIRQSRKSDQGIMSSSPVTADALMNGRENGIRSSGTNFSFSQNAYHAQASKDFSESFNLINQKALDLVEAGEAEVQQMHSALADADRLLQIAAADRAIVRQKVLQLSALMEDDTIDELEEDDMNLTREAEAVQEQIQHRAIHALVRAEEDKAASRNHANGITGENEMQTKYLAALQLAEEQVKRKELTTEVVRCLANEGMSETGEKCRRLMVATLRISEQTLTEMVDEVLEDLEMSKNDEGVVDGADMVVD